MVHGPIGFHPVGSPAHPIPVSDAQAKCESEGGLWNQSTRTCTPRRAGGKPVVFVGAKGEFAVPAKEAPELAREQARQRKELGLTSEGRGLADLGFETQPSPTEPTEGLVPGVSLAEAGIVAAREAIPRALTLAGGAAIAGATAGLATGGVASIPLAAAAAAVTFTGLITASMLSNMKSQRTDNVNAQQRSLDEGKQTLNDWITMAASDPTRRAESRVSFIAQLQIIQDAHVQMITDTNADIAQFETAVPNLEEFNTFYNLRGERDALVAEMDRALRGELTPEEVSFRMMDLAQRRLSQ